MVHLSQRQKPPSFRSVRAVDVPAPKRTHPLNLQKPVKPLSIE